MNTEAFKVYLEQRAQQIDKLLDRLLPAETVVPTILHRAMRYSIFAGGKRLRPILCLAAADAIGNEAPQAQYAAAALEILHTYTLIHDDLPSMDDDDLRRGRPTAHIEFGEANAILAGDALLTLAFELLATAPDTSAELQLAWISELSSAAGSMGVIGGQVEDMAANSEINDVELLSYIHQHKTADLLRCSCRMGALAAHANEAELEALSSYGNLIGHAFQISDDILDVTACEEELGKPIGSDEANQKLTFVAIHGLEAAQEEAQHLCWQANLELTKLNGSTAALEALANFIYKRSY